jgi:hypothetical protein
MQPGRAILATGLAIRKQKKMRFDTRTALEYAAQNRLEEWIHAYLLGGPWRNDGLSQGLKRQQRWWRGPLELPVAMLERIEGPEPGLEYPVALQGWEQSLAKLIDSIHSSAAGPLDMPPLILEFGLAYPAPNHLSVRDGNHRLGAYQRLSWPATWVIIWYNSEDDYAQHVNLPGITLVPTLRVGTS